MFTIQGCTTSVVDIGDRLAGVIDTDGQQCQEIELYVKNQSITVNCCPTVFKHFYQLALVLMSPTVHLEF